jgi:RNA polymerase sigma-70 factor (ECF subfamily)
MSTITVRKQSEAPVLPDFERLFTEHAPLIYRTAYAVMGNREDADDILQTIFLRLLRREFPPDLGRNPVAYLYRAAVNLSLDTIKIRGRQPQRTDDPEYVEARASDKPSFDDDVHRRLYEAIAKLNPKAAEILILRYVHNVSDAKIAEMLGVSRTVVAVRLYRTRVRLKKLLRAVSGENYEIR